jgi:hypothetical protein
VSEAHPGAADHATQDGLLDACRKLTAVELAVR